MYQTLLEQLNAWSLPMAEWLALAVALVIVGVAALVIYFVMQNVILRLLDSAAKRSQRVWQRALFGRNLFRRIVVIVQLILLNWQITLWLPAEFFLMAPASIVLQCLIIFYGMLSLFAMLDVALDFSMTSRAWRELPLRGLFQGIKLTLAIMASVLMISVLIGKSPLLLLSGLGAMTAVLLLVFRDPIMGLVAGIQLSANRMVAVGDWVQMPQYKADGDVVDINLTTVKVQNWDKTITTIPTYAMISDAFVNWRGMQNAGARRIKRSLNIDVRTVGYLSEAQAAQLAELPGVREYLDQQPRPTNLGAWQAYVKDYLLTHDEINQELTLMVRQLQPDSQGIPIEVYCFSKRTDWTAYEAVQSALFEQLYAMVPTFGLALFQAPSGRDLAAMGK